MTSHRRIMACVAINFVLNACAISQTVGLEDDPSTNSSETSDNGQGGAETASFPAPNNNPSCTVAESTIDGVAICSVEAPPGSFYPTVQWDWTAPGLGFGTTTWGSVVIPLVANFTDDNADGAIDLCDTPDVIVTVVDLFDGTLDSISGSIYVLAGDTGEQELILSHQINPFVTPALGDTDADGFPEVLAENIDGDIVAFATDGSTKWTGDSIVPLGYKPAWDYAAIAIYDLDGNGFPEILVNGKVFDNTGHLLWKTPYDGLGYPEELMIGADLDDDGNLEVLTGCGAYRSDGALLWEIMWTTTTSDGVEEQTCTPETNRCFPHVGNFDDDPDPEVFVSCEGGELFVVEGDGTLKVFDATFGDATTCGSSGPVAIDTFTGNEQSNFSVSTCNQYGVYTIDSNSVTKVWSQELPGSLGTSDSGHLSTGFDFLGSGIPIVLFSDADTLYALEGTTGKQVMTVPFATTNTVSLHPPYPVVADIDNDGSAEFIAVASYDLYSNDAPLQPTVTAYREEEDRWVPARRIWNQQAYHVTNVREDGTIPTQMEKNWQKLNTFRVNAQIEGSKECKPEPPK